MKTRLAIMLGVAWLAASGPALAHHSFAAEFDENKLRANWKRDSMKIGDVVAVESRQARDGSNHANAQTVVLTSTGQRLFAGSPLGQP